MFDNPATEVDDQATDRRLCERQIAILGELAELGLGVARDVGRLSKDMWAMEGVYTASLAHARVTRAVRMTLMLQAKLLKALRSGDLGKTLTAPAQRQAAQEDSDAQPGEQTGREVAERLDRDDIPAELLERPVGELVAMICKDLGLAPDWPRLAEEARAQRQGADWVSSGPEAEKVSTRSAQRAHEGHEEDISGCLTERAPFVTFVPPS